jgi:hypothetical protein
MILMFVLTLADIYAVLGFHILSCVGAGWCPEIGTSSNDWAPLSSFNLKTETESSLRNVACNI